MHFEIKEAFEKTRVAGSIAAGALDEVAKIIKPGISTSNIDKVCYEYINDHDACSAPLFYRGFPKSCCTSVNHVVCHGIPSDKILKEGDIVNVDVTAYKDKWHGDTSRMFKVGDISVKAERLINTTYEAMMNAIKIVKDPNDPKKTMAFLEAQLHVPEEYVENVLEWETGSSLWMGTNTKAGKAHRDMSWSEEEKLGYDTDMRELTVGVYVPMDEYGISRINSMIDFKPSEVAGSPVFEDYYSNVYQRPEGTIPAQNLEGNIRYGSVPQGSPYTSSTRQASNFSNTDEFQKAFSALPPEIQEKVALNLAQSQQQQQSQPVQSENPIMDVSLQPVMKEIMTQGYTPDKVMQMLAMLQNQNR